MRSHFRPDPRVLLACAAGASTMLTGIAHAAQIAQARLSAPAERTGKDALQYYDDFTQLLVEIAEAAGVAPTLGNDDVKDKPCGWLFDAAMVLEPFLHNELHRLWPTFTTKSEQDCA